MRFSEILSIGEAVLLEEPSTPAQAVLLMQRKTLKIGIDELTQKRDRFDAAIERLERELRRIDELAASVARMLAYDSPAKVKDIEFGRMLELVQKGEPGA